MKSVTEELKRRQEELRKEAERRERELAAFKEEAKTLKWLLTMRGWAVDDLGFIVEWAGTSPKRAQINVFPKGFKQRRAYPYEASIVLNFPLPEKEVIDQRIDALIEDLTDPYRWEEIKVKGQQTKKDERGLRRWLRKLSLRI